jgi:cell division protease FtsH
VTTTRPDAHSGTLVVYDVITTGSEYDLETATRTARSMVGRWGMSGRIAPMSVLPSEGDVHATASHGLLDAVDAEVRRILDESYADARQTLREHRTQLDAIAQVLLEKETIDEVEVYEAAGIPRGDRHVPDLPRTGHGPNQPDARDADRRPA